MKRILLLLGAIVVVVVGAAELENLSDVAAQLPDFFQRSFLHVHIWQWGGLLAVLLLCTLFGFVVRSLARRGTHLRDRFAPQPMGEATRASVATWTGVLGAALLPTILLPSLVLDLRFEHDLETLLDGVRILAVVLLAYAWWDAVSETLASRATGNERVERLLVPIARKFVRAMIVIAGLLFALGDFFTVKTVTGLVAGLGVGGLVVALAAKDSVENVFGSFTILFDMPFALGSWVKIDKVEGVVEEINLRSTRIRTFEDTMITLPNANLIRAAVENYGARRVRRQRMSLRLSYDCAPAAIDAYCDALRSYLEEQPDVEKNRVVVQMDDPSETSIGVLVQWCLNLDNFPEEAKRRHAFLDEALRLRKVHHVVFAAAPRPPESPDAPPVGGG